MTHGKESSRPGPAPQQPQPAVLISLVLALNAARRQMSLYGPNHPNTGQSAEGLSQTFGEFANAFGRATLVFTQTAALVNEHAFSASSESQELFGRLRARGVMAVTIVSPPPPEQIVTFIGFLNEEPDVVRAQGGASAFLRKRGVSLIVATDAVYSSGDGADEAEDGPQATPDPKDIDRALGAAIDWLLKQDDDEEEVPRLPIAEILSSPDEAAKLIREAVTKLHASRRQDTRGQIAGEVVHDLKDLAADDPDKWDSATPQIRKAMSKLPKEMRPEIAGFTEDDASEEAQQASRSSHVADIFEIESQIAEIIGESLSSNAGLELPAPDAFSSLFGASASGLLSSWRRELQPGMVIGSSARTIGTLMEQETRAVEHERIARALASLFPRSIEMKDLVSARDIVGGLLRETERGESDDWRVANARSALQSLDKGLLRQAALAWSVSADARAKQVAAHLVETLPELALTMVDLLGSRDHVELSSAIGRGVARCGTAAISPLGRLLVSATDGAKDLALNALIDMGLSAAMHEISRSLAAANEVFVVRALARLSSVRHPDIVDASVGLLASNSSAVRCAALAALGEFAVPTTVPAIIRAASRRGLSEEDIAEKTAALEALGRMDSDEARDYLEKTASRYRLLGKKRYEIIRATAERILKTMRQEKTDRKAA